jgi:hypothetical protein
LDGRGSTVAFAKVGISAFTRSLVRREAETLSSLAGRDWHRLVLPSVVHHGSWQGHEVLVQQALRPRSRPTNASVLLSEAMVELARSSGTHNAALATSSYWHGLMSRLRELPAGERQAELLVTAHEVERRWGSLVLDFGAWHGDWAPWNMGYAGQRVLVWDWEGFALGVPLGLDAIHHHVQSSVVVEGLAPESAVESASEACPGLLAHFGVSAETSQVVVLLYVLELATTYLESGESGTRMARLDDWLSVVLTSQLRRVSCTHDESTVHP